MADTDHVSDAEVLEPDQDLVISGETVTVRAFRMFDGLRATPIARPIISSIREMATAGDEIDADQLMDLLGRHAEEWMQLVALATGRSRQWLDTLTDEEGLALAMTFWQVNAGFFMTRLAIGMPVEPMGPAGGASSTSSANSSPQAMDATPENSPSATPGAPSAGSSTPNSAESAGGEPI